MAFQTKKVPCKIQEVKCTNRLYSTQVKIWKEDKKRVRELSHLAFASNGERSQRGNTGQLPVTGT
jgi:hypothetical protein